ncbi:MAG: DUF523 domain-containing protein [Planctomycetes bacterium]|nr:DUF523 domain-containing protein [Planctomycetota bacterium]
MYAPRDSGKIVAPAGRVLVSACLLGIRCRYDGRDALRQEIVDLRRGGAIVAVCPEELGGLGTPRPPAEIESLAGAARRPPEIPPELGPFAEVPREAQEGESDANEVWAGRARVLAADGSDVTDAYVRGAILTARIARDTGVTRAYLKARSPSCGSGTLSRRGRRVAGDGVTAWLLKRMGIEVVSVD